MILLDGKKLAQDILAQVKKDIEKVGKPLRLAVIVAGNDPATESFIAQKQKTARSVGIDVIIYRFEEGVTTEGLCQKVGEISRRKEVSGVIVQLPLPRKIRMQEVLNVVTAGKDVDVLSENAVECFIAGKHPIMPPVAGAVKAFFEAYAIPYKMMRIVVAGAGNLVGKPVAWWLSQEGATFTVVTSESKNPIGILREADVIISGTGQAQWISGDMVKKGAVVIDAGTSESEGEIAGDVDFDSVAKKTSYLTPVPGGMGPVTVAILLKNLTVLAQRQ